MGAKLGSEKLGSLYSGGEVRKRREWRGVKDTLYDYSCWLKTMGVLRIPIISRGSCAIGG